MEAGKSTHSDLEDKDLPLDNFSIPKGRFANTRSRAKNGTKVNNFPTNPTRYVSIAYSKTNKDCTLIAAAH